MKLYDLIVDAQPVLTSFSPVEIIEYIVTQCKKQRKALSIDIYTTEVK